MFDLHYSDPFVKSFLSTYLLSFGVVHDMCLEILFACNERDLIIQDYPQ